MIMIKYIITLLILINISYYNFADYRLTVEDVNIEYSIDEIYNSKKIITPVNLTVIPLTDKKESLFITFSYGGLTFKDTAQYLNHLSTETSYFKQNLTTPLRKLYSDINTIDYELKLHPNAITQLEPLSNVVDQSNVLTLYKYKRLEILEDIKKQVFITIDNTKVYPAGNYIDIFTVNFYSGTIEKSNEALLNSRQIKVNLTIPKISKIIQTSLTKVPNSKDMYIFKITFISTTDTNLHIAKDMSPMILTSVSDGIDNLEETKTDFIYYFPFSNKQHSKEFLVMMKDYKKSMPNEKKGFYFNYKINEL